MGPRQIVTRIETRRVGGCFLGHQSPSSVNWTFDEPSLYWTSPMMHYPINYRYCRDRYTADALSDVGKVLSPAFAKAEELHCLEVEKTRETSTALETGIMTARTCPATPWTEGAVPWQPHDNPAW